MVESKKKINFKRKTFLTKKNLRGGNPRRPPPSTTQQTSAGRRPPPPPPRDISGYQPSIQNVPIPLPDTNEKILETNRFIKDTIRFFKYENEDYCIDESVSEEKKKSRLPIKII